MVQNEFGEISIDDELIQARYEGKNEDIVVTNSGCLCCTVRGDLVEIFQNNLLPKFNDIDHVNDFVLSLLNQCVFFSTC